MPGVSTPQSVSPVTTTRTRVLVAADLTGSFCATFLSFLARFEGWPPPPPYGAIFLEYALVACVLRIIVFNFTGAYSQAWRYASVREAVLLAYTGIIASILTGAVGRMSVLEGGTSVPWSILLLDTTLFMGAAIGVRLIARARRQSAFGRSKLARDGRRTLIIGAGSAGQLVARELTDSSRTGMVPFGFLDDDASLHGKRILGLPVLGYTSDMVDIAKAASLDLVVIATPSAPGTLIRKIVQLAAIKASRQRTQGRITVRANLSNQTPHLLDKLRALA